MQPWRPEPLNFTLRSHTDYSQYSDAALPDLGRKTREATSTGGGWQVVQCEGSQPKTTPGNMQDQGEESRLPYSTLEHLLMVQKRFYGLETSPSNEPPILRAPPMEFLSFKSTESKPKTEIVRDEALLAIGGGPLHPEPETTQMSPPLQSPDFNETQTIVRDARSITPRPRRFSNLSSSSTDSLSVFVPPPVERDTVQSPPNRPQSRYHRESQSPFSTQSQMSTTTSNSPTRKLRKHQSDGFSSCSKRDAYGETSEVEGWAPSISRRKRRKVFGDTQEESLGKRSHSESQRGFIEVSSSSSKANQTPRRYRSGSSTQSSQTPKARPCPSHRHSPHPRSTSPDFSSFTTPPSPNTNHDTSRPRTTLSPGLSSFPSPRPPKNTRAVSPDFSSFVAAPPSSPSESGTPRTISMSSRESSPLFSSETFVSSERKQEEDCSNSLLIPPRRKDSRYTSPLPQRRRRRQRSSSPPPRRDSMDVDNIYCSSPISSKPSSLPPVSPSPSISQLLSPPKTAKLPFRNNNNHRTHPSHPQPQPQPLPRSPRPHHPVEKTTNPDDRSISILQPRRKSPRVLCVDLPSSQFGSKHPPLSLSETNKSQNNTSAINNNNANNPEYPPHFIKQQQQASRAQQPQPQPQPAPSSLSSPALPPTPDTSGFLGTTGYTPFKKKPSLPTDISRSNEVNLTSTIGNVTIQDSGKSKPAHSAQKENGVNEKEAASMLRRAEDMVRRYNDVNANATARANGQVQDQKPNVNLGSNSLDRNNHRLETRDPRLIAKEKQIQGPSGGNGTGESGNDLKESQANDPRFDQWSKYQIRLKDPRLVWEKYDQAIEKAKREANPKLPPKTLEEPRLFQNPHESLLLFEVNDFDTKIGPLIRWREPPGLVLRI